jgi:3-deoxy-D-arabino-heptulosonate 7-phosphate (DAHP) synthase
MIFAGPCLYIDETSAQEVYDTAKELANMGKVVYFRCKLWGGGTVPSRYFPGIGKHGLSLFDKIRELIPVGTEVQTPSQYKLCVEHVDYVWIGARNSQNYGLRKYILQARLEGKKIAYIIKRGFAMTVDELYGLYDIDHPDYIIDRGILTIDPMPRSRFAPDLKGIIRIKNERPDIFENIIIDCSHSNFRKEYIKDTYIAFKAIGVNHFMFECTATGQSITDQEHMLSVQEFNEILGE